MGGSVGEAGAPPSEAGGSSTSAGTDSGGNTGDSAGADTGGSTNAGTGASAGTETTAGSGGSTNAGGAGGSTAGSGPGGGTGRAGSGGSGGATDCKTLQAEYGPLLEKARVCDKGSTNECSPSSTLPSNGTCGCPVLVNSQSEATMLAQKKYKQMQDYKCTTGIVCSNIACLAVNSASCAQQTSGMGTGFVCTGSAAVTN